MIFFAEYIWVDEKNNFRSKTNVVHVDKKDKFTPTSYPIWNYDGSSTGQANGNDSEVYIKPQKLYKDPFRPGNNYIVLCDTWLPDLKTPHPTNTRVKCNKIMKELAGINFYDDNNIIVFMGAGSITQKAHKLIKENNVRKNSRNFKKIK